jgi:TRAP-type C4-dicarboxylate transport system substrate-binding protein
MGIAKTKKIAKIMAVAGLCSSVPLSALATELKLASFVPARHQLQVNVWEPLAKELAEATGGELQLQIYPGGQLGAGGNEQYNRVVDGVADIAHGMAGYTSVLFPKTLLIELPGVPHSSEQATEGLWKAMPMIQDEFRRVKPIALFTSSDAMLMTRNTLVRSPEDLKGLKIRVPSAGVGEAVAAWGATPVSMPISDVYNAAQTGVIDGALLDGSTLRTYKLFEVFDNYTTGIPSTTSTVFLLMNRDSYEGLSDDERQALDKVAGLELSRRSHRAFEDAHEGGLKLIRGMESETVIELTAKESKAFEKRSRKVVDEAVAALEKRGVDNARQIVETMGQAN